MTQHGRRHATPFVFPVLILSGLLMKAAPAPQPPAPPPLEPHGACCRTTEARAAAALIGLERLTPIAGAQVGGRANWRRPRAPEPEDGGGRLIDEEAGAVAVSSEVDEARPLGRRGRIERGRSLEAQGRLDEAQEVLESALADSPGSSEILCRLAKVSLYLKEYDRAQELLKQAREAQSGYALCDAVEGLYLFCMRDTRGAISLVDRAIRSDADLKEAYLIKADILFAIRDLDGARRLLDAFLTRFPQDPEGLYLSGIVAFYRKDLTRAMVLLESSLRLNRRAINVRKDLIQVYSLTERPEKALRLLDELLGEKPDDKALIALRSGLRERLRLKRDGKLAVREPFHFLYPKDISTSTLKRIMDTFVAALGEVCRHRTRKPKHVQVTILNSTDQLLPAYYNHVSDEITISRQYYEGLDTPRKMELGRHLIFHEFSHLALYQELGDVSLPPAALWLVEGLAEYEAGGYTYTHVDYDETFADGFYELETLEEYLPVSAMAKGRAREKAYIQSYLMAATLLESVGEAEGLDRIKKMAHAYTRQGPDHETVFSEVLQVTPREFLSACKRQMRRLAQARRPSQTE
jgi:tetratricopeptide (TPR) repeat protein